MQAFERFGWQHSTLIKQKLGVGDEDMKGLVLWISWKGGEAENGWNRSSHG